MIRFLVSVALVVFMSVNGGFLAYAQTADATLQAQKQALRDYSNRLRSEESKAIAVQEEGVTILLVDENGNFVGMKQGANKEDALSKLNNDPTVQTAKFFVVIDSIAAGARIINEFTKTGKPILSIIKEVIPRTFTVEVLTATKNVTVGIAKKAVASGLLGGLARLFSPFMTGGGVGYLIQTQVIDPAIKESAKQRFQDSLLQSEKRIIESRRQAAIKTEAVKQLQQENNLPVGGGIPTSLYDQYYQRINARIKDVNYQPIIQ